jgi:hypothetical protein
VPQAWGGGETTTAAALADALSAKAGKPLPWVTVRAALGGALQARLLELAVDSAPWPSDAAGAARVKVRLPGKPAGEREPPVVRPEPVLPAGVRVAQAELRPNQLQDLADQVGELTRAAVGFELRFCVRVELGGKMPPPAELVEKVNKLLAEVAEELRLR